MIYGHAFHLLTWFAVWRDGNKSPHHARGLLHRGCPAHPFVVLGAGGHQLSHQDPLQTAVIYALPQPSATGKPAQQTRIAHYFPELCGQATSQQASVTPETCSLVSVPRNLVADENALHQPLCVEPRVIVTHLYCRQLAQVLALRRGERERDAQHSIKHPKQKLHL